MTLATDLATDLVPSCTARLAALTDSRAPIPVKKFGVIEAAFLKFGMIEAAFLKYPESDCQSSE